LIVGRTLAAVTALVVLATATTIAVVAAAFAFFFALEPVVGRAGAAGLLAGLLALLVSITVLIVASRGNAPHHDHGHGGGGIPDFSFVERIIEMAKDKPILAAAAAVAAGLIVVRNPALVATIITAIMQKPKND
jgi:hypothetical protein